MEQQQPIDISEEVHMDAPSMHRISGIVFLVHRDHPLKFEKENMTPFEETLRLIEHNIADRACMGFFSYEYEVFYDKYKDSIFWKTVAQAFEKVGFTAIYSTGGAIDCIEIKWNELKQRPESKLDEFSITTAEQAQDMTSQKLFEIEQNKYVCTKESILETIKNINSQITTAAKDAKYETTYNFGLAFSIAVKLEPQLKNANFKTKRTSNWINDIDDNKDISLEISWEPEPDPEEEQRIREIDELIKSSVHSKTINK